MCKVIVIGNQKGGVGKTTTTSNLGIGLAKKGKKVLLIDADAQGSLTASLGFQEPDKLDVSLATIMANIINEEDMEPASGILKHDEGVDLMPGNIELSGLEVSLVNVMSRELVLRTYIEQQKERYDYILIDCMPSLGMITINAFASADSILIPVQAAYLPVKGLEQLIKTIGKVKRQINPKLEIEGILLTMVDNRTNYAKDISALVVENYGSKVRIFENSIPMSVRAAEISAEGVSIYEHDPNGKVASAYQSLTERCLQMNKMGSAAKVKLNSFDDLFRTEQPQAGTEQVQEIALSELHEFKGHPFKVLDDEKMQETVESVREHGVLMPGIARPRAEGGYEIIAGHRRRHACELVGLETMPMFIRNYTDDEATIIMVDSNIQREDILPSEKAKAYRMKYDAMKHQGSRTGGLTLEELGEAAGESAKTVQRYIWISRLSEPLLDMVDAGKIGIMQSVDLSFLSEDAQQWVLVAIQDTNAVISKQQSAMLKESDKKGELTFPMVRMLLEKEKPVERKVVIKTERINSYFPDTYSTDDIEKIIFQLLDNWKNTQ